MEVKCFNCLLNLFSMYTFCKIPGMLLRCLFSSHQIITTVFTTGILYLFLVEQSYRKILCHRYEMKRGNAGPLLFDTPFSFLSWGICWFLLYWSGHLANIFILISVEYENKNRLCYVCCNTESGVCLLVDFYCLKGTLIPQAENDKLVIQFVDCSQRCIPVFCLVLTEAFVKITNL